MIFFNTNYLKCSKNFVTDCKSAQYPDFSSYNGVCTKVLGFSIAQSLQLCELTYPRSVEWASSVHNMLDNQSLPIVIFWNAHTANAHHFTKSSGNSSWWRWTLYGQHRRVCRSATQTIVYGMPVRLHERWLPPCVDELAIISISSWTVRAALALGLGRPLQAYHVANCRWQRLSSKQAVAWKFEIILFTTEHVIEPLTVEYPSYGDRIVKL